MSMSELIKHLVAKCGPGDTSYLSDKNTSFLLLCDYKANITNSKDDIIPLVRERFLIENFLFFIQKLSFNSKIKGNRARCLRSNMEIILGNYILPFDVGNYFWNKSALWLVCSFFSNRSNNW